MADYPNGRIPPEALTPLSVGGSLLYSAAASFERWRTQAAAAGRELTITSPADAYRSFTQQETVFLQRYEVVPGNGPFNDVRTYNGRRYVRLRGAAAAVPGTSNHGRGIAIDVKNAGAFGGSFHTWLSSTGPALGWSNDEGRSVSEPWHWVHVASSTNPNPPTSEEDDMTPAQAAQLDYIFSAIAPGESGVRNAGHVLVQLGRIEAEANAAKENTKPITRGGAQVSLRQEIANIGTAVTGLPASVWGYSNAKLEAGDVYSILRKIRDAVVGK